MLHKISIKNTYFSLLLVTVIGLGLSVTAFFYVKQWEAKQAIEIHKKQHDYVRVLQQTFITLENILNSITGLYHVHSYINQENFTKFAKSDLLNHSGIQALEWVSVTPTSENLFWELSPLNKRQSVGQRNVYYPVQFNESKNNYISRLGYDIGSNAILKRALETARDSGQFTASGVIEILTDTGKTLGLNVFMPVYKDNNPSNFSIEERRHNIIGFTIGVLSLNNLAEEILRIRKQRANVVLQIFDKTPDAKVQTLYSPTWYKTQPYDPTKELWQDYLDIGGRLWQITFSKISDAPFHQTWYAWIVLGMGLLFTSGLLRYIYVILVQFQWADKLVAKRTQSLYSANQALNKEIKVREQMTKDLYVSRQRFQAIFDEAAIGILQTSLTGDILDSNRASRVLFRYREQELNHKCLKDLIHPDDASKDQFMLEKMLAGKYDSYQISKRYICKNGTIIWANQSSSIARDANQSFIINMIEDITERKYAEEARREAEKKYRDIFENAIEGIFQCNPKGHYLSVNPAFVRIFGYESAEQVYTETDDSRKHIYVDSKRYLEFLDLLETRSNLSDFEYQACCKNGRVIWVNETIRVVRDEGKIRYYEGIVEDITERKLNEEKLRHDATHDQLTGLLNRAAFTNLLTKELVNLTATKKTSFAVLFVDLDRFKIVNDSLGHFVGDQLLTELAQRLQKTIDKNDIVARFGGDEFSILLKDIANHQSLKQRVNILQAQLCKPYTLKNENFSTTASIGISLSDLKYNNADDMLRDADTAMYEAKKQGRGKFLIFQSGMRDKVVNMLRMEADLRKALDREEFRLYYQPIISLENCNTVGLEALIRWIHPEKGLIPPDNFIPLAEESGLIEELGLWVFETACTQLKRWQTQFQHHTNLGMNINVSPIQFKQPRLVRQIQDIIENSGIKGPTCRVEITETAMMQDPEKALKLLNDLKSLEILLYIDDFGTGYSSLSYLQKFPIDALKIDKSFIQEIDISSKSAQIIYAVIALGKAFDLRIVAEGVENELQASMLKTAKCNHVQGYLFSKPQTVESLEKFLSIETHNLIDTECVVA
ncbi:EAL domain-containing protein [Candidatus Halobeggiatoa sp. HSG11]|nr:EAL domain-containing protein [Candidatus Halobeggiatoa sp. HSG11]